MKAIRILFIMVVVAAAGGAAGVFGTPYLREMGILPAAASDGAKDDKENRRSDPSREVTALGRLEPESEVIDVGGPAGSRIDRLGDKVKEGAWIEKDEPIAYLDSYPELLAARDLAQAQLDEARERLKAETAFGDAAVEAAKLKIRFAKEVMPKQIEAQDAEVRRSQAELDKSKLDLTRSNKMLADRAIPQSQHDVVALQARQFEEQLQRNVATLEQLKIDREIKLLTGEADLKSAEAGLKRAELSTLVQSLESAVKAAQVRLDRSVIKAPLEGEIIKILTRPGESVGAHPILKMGDTKSMFAIAEVYETDARFVSKGQKATVTSRAFPDKLTGVVERKATLIFKNDVLALDPAKDADSRVIEVRIRLDDNSVAGKYCHLQVDVTISRDNP